MIPIVLFDNGWVDIFSELRKQKNMDSQTIRSAGTSLSCQVRISYTPASDLVQENAHRYERARDQPK